MLRCALRRHPLSSSRSPHRFFHTSPKRTAQSNNIVHDAVVEFASSTPVFHNLFPIIHDLTSLPWLVSIPLTTVLVRSLVTPFRYYLALCRRDQRLAAPKLSRALKIVSKQSEIRKAGDVESLKQTNIWTYTQWRARRGAILKEFPRALPHPLVFTNSNFDVTNVASMILVAMNTSTILSQSISIPELAELNTLQGLEVALSSCFFALAILNNMHYYGNVFVRRDGASTGQKPTWTFIGWTRHESRVTTMIGVPFITGIVLSCCPQPVILSVLSNSVYSLFERKLIHRMTGVPPYREETGPFRAAQFTRLQKAGRQPNQVNVLGKRHLG